MDLSPRLVDQMIKQLPYVFEDSKEFGKSPKPKNKLKGKPTNKELLQQAEQLNIKVPERVKYQMNPPS